MNSIYDPQPEPYRERRTTASRALLSLAGPLLLGLLLAACTPAPPDVERHPDLAAPSPNPLELSADAGETATGDIQLHNAGAASLTYSVGVDQGWLSASPSSGSIAPDEYRSFTVSAACPAIAGDYAGVVAIDSNDPSPPSQQVDVTLACAEPPPPPPAAVTCEEVEEGAAGPTLRCVSAEAGVTVNVPWQGQDVRVESLSLHDFGETPAQAGFEPLGGRPAILLAIYEGQSDVPRQSFDPPLEVWVEYDEEDFDATTPLLQQGELGLGVWDEQQALWTIAGYGVFHDGFWVADPIGGDGLVLQGNRAKAQPRFQITGKPDGGRVAALFSEIYATLPIALGAVPFDADHMLKSFDSCESTTVVGMGEVVECSSAMVGLTVRVPLQEGGTVTPRVIALPWNKASTFIATEVEDAAGTNDWETDLQRRLMNFVVVDAAYPDRVLTSFDPPMEFEVTYAPEDKDPEANPVLRMNYWDEYVEEFVVLGEGACTACRQDDGSPSVGCQWGTAVEAGATSDPEFGGAFFVVDSASGQGRAKFTFNRWGDRMMAFAR